jgi:magnesium transporter
MSDRKEMSSTSGTPSEALGRTEETPARITLIDFDSTDMTVQENSSIQECTMPTDSSLVRWVHLEGVHERASVEQIGGRFGIHTLLVEDILSTKHRPMMDVQSGHLCLILPDIRLESHHQME